MAYTSTLPAGNTMANQALAADGRALARSLRVAGRVDPVFVENIADVPQTILEVARDGDVVITMGAGSIGGVPGKLVQG